MILPVDCQFQSLSVYILNAAPTVQAADIQHAISLSYIAVAELLINFNTAGKCTARTELFVLGKCLSDIAAFNGIGMTKKKTIQDTIGLIFLNAEYL
jgi:hypothetical protein